MKRIICLLVVICTLVFSLTSCAVVQGALLGIFTATTSEAGTKVEEMVYALAEDRKNDALALMHPAIKETSIDGIASMVDYIGERQIESMQQTGYYFSTQVGLIGLIKQEQVTYTVIFTDGTAIGVDSIYTTTPEGTGFERFIMTITDIPENDAGDNSISDTDKI